LSEFGYIAIYTMMMLTFLDVIFGSSHCRKRHGLYSSFLPPLDCKAPMGRKTGAPKIPQTGRLTPLRNSLLCPLSLQSELSTKDIGSLGEVRTAPQGQAIGLCSSGSFAPLFDVHKWVRKHRYFYCHSFVQPSIPIEEFLQSSTPALGRTMQFLSVAGC
jgi:hypothetical protein